MDDSKLAVAQQVVQPISALHRHRTGHVFKAMTVVLREDTLVSDEIKRITGVRVREAAAQVETITRTVVFFAAGTDGPAVLAGPARVSGSLDREWMRQETSRKKTQRCWCGAEKARSQWWSAPALSKG